MARRALILGVASPLALLAAGFVAVALLAPLPPPAGWPPESADHEVAAVLHVHSAYSHDGRGSIEEIAEAARRAGVRVVLLTDHNTLAPLAEGKEGWHGDVLVLVGAELTTGSGYLLVFNLPADATVRVRGHDLRRLVAEYQDLGGIVLVAHPYHPKLDWKDWEMAGLDGLEVVDVFDQVVVAAAPRQLLAFLAYPANPAMAVLSLVHWPRQALARWDLMAARRPAVGVLALDAHGGIALTEETGVRFPSHETAFRLGRLHFLLPEPLDPDPGVARRQVYQALRAGRFFNAFDGLAPATGFRFRARAGGEVHEAGARLGLTADLELEVTTPPYPRAVIRLLRDGVVVREERDTPQLRHRVWMPGVFRVEVDLERSLFPLTGPRAFPWIFSNPIYVER